MVHDPCQSRPYRGEEKLGSGPVSIPTLPELSRLHERLQPSAHSRRGMRCKRWAQVGKYGQWAAAQHLMAADIGAPTLAAST